MCHFCSLLNVTCIWCVVPEQSRAGCTEEAAPVYRAPARSPAALPRSQGEASRAWQFCTPPEPCAPGKQKWLRRPPPLVFREKAYCKQLRFPLGLRWDSQMPLCLLRTRPDTDLCTSWPVTAKYQPGPSCAFSFPSVPELCSTPSLPSWPFLRICRPQGKACAGQLSSRATHFPQLLLSRLVYSSLQKQSPFLSDLWDSCRSHSQKILPIAMIFWIKSLLI